MAAVSEAVARVQDYCRQLGMERDHPLCLALVIAVETAETARETCQGARGLTREGEAELVLRTQETVERRVDDRIDLNASRIAKRIAGGLALKAGAAGIALLAVGLIVGRVTAPDAEAQVLEGASFMAQLAEMNDAHTLRDYCLKHRVAAGGGVVCDMPRVWVRPPAK